MDTFTKSVFGMNNRILLESVAFKLSCSYNDVQEPIKYCLYEWVSQANGDAMLFNKWIKLRHLFICYLN